MGPGRRAGGREGGGTKKQCGNEGCTVPTHKLGGRGGVGGGGRRGGGGDVGGGGTREQCGSNEGWTGFFPLDLKNLTTGPICVVTGA